MTANEIVAAAKLETDEQLAKYLAACDLQKCGAGAYVFVRQTQSGDCLFESPRGTLLATVTPESVTIARNTEVWR